MTGGQAGQAGPPSLLRDAEPSEQDRAGGAGRDRRAGEAESSRSKANLEAVDSAERDYSEVV